MDLIFFETFGRYEQRNLYFIVDSGVLARTGMRLDQVFIVDSGVLARTGMRRDPKDPWMDLDARTSSRLYRGFWGSGPHRNEAC